MVGTLHVRACPRPPLYREEGLGHLSEKIGQALSQVHACL